MNKSESSKFRYEVWEDPNRCEPNLYIKYFKKVKGLFFGVKWQELGKIGHAYTGVIYFNSLDEALQTIQAQIKKDDPAPHIKRWP